MKWLTDAIGVAGALMIVGGIVVVRPWWIVGGLVVVVLALAIDEGGK